jgi:hypothetical protein
MMMNATPLNHEDRPSYERRSSISSTSSSSSIATVNGSLLNEQLATLPFIQDTHQALTLQTAKAIVSSADAIEQALKESGRSYDPNLPMQFAMTNHTLSREISAREQAEKRGYMYDSFQKDVDREISQQQHQENIACKKEAPKWSQQLMDARNRCVGSISTAIVRGIVLVALTKLAPFMYYHVLRNEGASFMAVAGDIIETIYPCPDSGINESTSSSMYSWISYSWSYAGSYLVPVIPQDWGLSFCQICRGLLILGFVCFFFAVGFGARRAFGREAGSFAQSVLLTCILSSHLVIPDISRLLFLQAILTFGASTCLTAIYWSARRSLRNIGTLPSRALVSETLLPIEDVSTLIELSPILLVIVTIVGIVTSA